MISTLKIKYLNNITVNKDSFEEKIKNIDNSTNYDYFILNGNIGNPFETYYKKFLEYCFEKIKTKNIFIIGGDFEYSFDTYENVNNKIKNVIDIINKNSNKIIFFENKCISFRNIIFIGSSLLKNDSEKENFLLIEKNIEKGIKSYLEICLITFNEYEIPLKFKNTLIYNINSKQKENELNITIYN
jgi:hypothetical protein